MLIASKNGNITAATLISEGDHEWCLSVENREVRISKSDARQRVFEKMSDALTWAGAEQELIDHFAAQDAVTTDSAGLAAC